MHSNCSVILFYDSILSCSPTRAGACALTRTRVSGDRRCTHSEHPGSEAASALSSSLNTLKPTRLPFSTLFTQKLWGAAPPQSQPFPELCTAETRAWRRAWGGLPVHPSPARPQEWCCPGYSLDELPSKGFQFARRCCCCQQQVQALPRQHVTQDPQQTLRGRGVIRIHGLQKKYRKDKSRGMCATEQQ